MLLDMRVRVDAQAFEALKRLFTWFACGLAPIFILTEGLSPSSLLTGAAVAVGAALAIWLPMMLFDLLGAIIRAAFQITVQARAAPRTPSDRRHTSSRIAF